MGHRRVAGPEVGYLRLMLAAAGMGVIGGLVALGYYFLLQGGLTLVWKLGPAWLESHWPALGASPWLKVLITTLSGLSVGLTLRWLGVPGELSTVVNNIHLEHGRLEISQSPRMFFNSLCSISFGGSAGPEAPLVQIIGSLGSWWGQRLQWHGHWQRMLTICGMSAALGAFFGAPLGGALFALEIPHRRGLEYYEALLPALLASLVSYGMFRSVVGYESTLYSFVEIPPISFLILLQGVGLGVIGALSGAMFIGSFRLIGRLTHRFQKYPVRLATCGGFLLGCLTLFFPSDLPTTLLFWGELQSQQLVQSVGEWLPRYGLAMGCFWLVSLAGAKILAISLTLHSGFRGGFIFPLFLVGGCLGLALSLGSGGAITPAIGMLCMMAAINVAVTKTPISTPLILATLSNGSLLPVLLVASLVSFLVSNPLALIATQRSRESSFRQWVERKRDKVQD